MIPQLLRQEVEDVHEIEKAEEESWPALLINLEKCGNTAGLRIVFVSTGLGLLRF